MPVVRCTIGFAGKQNLRSSTIFTTEQAAAIAPMMDTSNLKAACVYHDGSFNDTRYNVSLATTAIKNGATVLNYFEVEQLLKDDKGKLYGVRAKDLETNETYEIKATSVVNATGPFSDKILEMDEDPKGLPPKSNNHQEWLCHPPVSTLSYLNTTVQLLMVC